MLKVLIVSSSCWRKDSSFGNTFSNWFEGMDGVEIANIYLDGKKPDGNACATNFFQINEQQLIKNIKNKKFLTGKRIYKEDSQQGVNEKSSVEKKSFMSFAKKKRWTIFFVVRKLIWKLGKWENDNLYKFVEEFKPDVIFQPIYYNSAANKIAYKIKQKYNIPMIGFIGDDVYTLKQLSFSPLFWIDRFANRKNVKKTVDACSLLYVATDLQKRDYEKVFNCPIKVLMKFGVFEKKEPVDEKKKEIVKFAYTGNLGDGRWKSVVKLAQTLSKTGGGYLEIYSKSELSNRVVNKLNIEGVSSFKGAIDFKTVCEVQQNADVLVFVESMKLKEKLKVRQSFSTKIVDYLSIPKCIVAIGPKDIAPIQYLQENDAACVINEYKDLEEKISELISSADMMSYYRDKAWNLGVRNHVKRVKQMELKNDIEGIASIKGC